MASHCRVLGGHVRRAVSGRNCDIDLGTSVTGAIESGVSERLDNRQRDDGTVQCQPANAI